MEVIQKDLAKAGLNEAMRKNAVLEVRIRVMVRVRVRVSMG